VDWSTSGGGGRVNREAFVELNGALLVHRIACDIEYAAHDSLTTGIEMGCAGVGDLEPALEAFGGGHGDGANQFVHPDAAALRG